MALLQPEKISDLETLRYIKDLIAPYNFSPSDYFIKVLAEGIATIAAAFYPKEVIVRMSDFKSNEYAALIGGAYFEKVEPNPMLGKILYEILCFYYKYYYYYCYSV